MGSLCSNQSLGDNNISLCIEKRNNDAKNKFFQSDKRDFLFNEHTNKKDKILFEEEELNNYLLKDDNNISNNKNIENSQIDQNITKYDNENKEINIYFLFNNKKELYLSVNTSQIFEEVQKLISEKYNWINYFDDISYYYHNNCINNKKTISELGINNDDTIIIKAK